MDKLPNSPSNSLDNTPSGYNPNTGHLIPGITQEANLGVAVTPQSLPAAISEEDQDALLSKLFILYTDFQSSVSSLHSEIDVWRKAYETETTDGSDEDAVFPWPNASNFVVPLIMSTVDSIHARIVRAVFDVDPIWMAQPRTSEGVQSATKAQWYLDYWADRMDLAQHMDVVFHSMLIDGVGILKLDWAKLVRGVPSQSNTPGAPIPTPFLTPVGAGMGQQNSTVTEYDGPIVHQVPLKDFILIPATSPTIDDAVYVGHKVWLTVEQLQQRGNQGVYFNVDKLIERIGQSDANEDSAMMGLIAPQKPNMINPETNKFEVVELYGPYDFGDGPVPSIMTFNPEFKILLRVDPYPYGYDRAPYVDFKVYPLPNSFWARSLPQILLSSQEELTALHNMRTDAIVRKISPPLQRLIGATDWDPDEQPWAPGQVIDVNESGAIREIPLSDIPQGAFAHENDIMAFAERVSGASDNFMGRAGASPYRSATEINAVSTGGNIRIDVMVKRTQQSMRKLAWFIWWLLYQYRPFYDYFFADNTGMTIDKQEMRPIPNGLMPFEFIPQGMQSDSTKEAKRQQDMQLLSIVAPFLNQHYPDGIRYMLDKLLMDFNFQDRTMILGPSWNALQQMMQQAFQAGAQEGAKTAQQPLQPSQPQPGA